MIKHIHDLFVIWGADERGGMPGLSYPTTSLEYRVMTELAPTKGGKRTVKITAYGKEKRYHAPKKQPENHIADTIREVMREIQDPQVVRACKLYYISTFRNFETAAAMMPRQRIGRTRIGVSADYFKRLLFRAHKRAYSHIYYKEYEGCAEEI